MPIRLNNLGGIIPKIDPTELGEKSAQHAHNVDLVSNTLRPINVKSPFVDMKTDDVLNSDIDEEDIFSIEEAPQPILVEKLHLADNPAMWIKCRRGLHVSSRQELPEGAINLVQNRRSRTIWGGNKVISSGGKLTDSGVSMVDEMWQTPYKVDYNENGIRLYFNFEAFAVDLETGWGHTVKNGIFQFELEGNIENGGPDETEFIPLDFNVGSNNSNLVSYSSYNKHISSDQVPLTMNNNPGEVYGIFRVKDVIDGNLQTDGVLEGGTTYFSIWGYTTVIDIDISYVRSSRKVVFYTQTMVKERGEDEEDDIEGVPSELSERIVVLPGEYLKLSLPFLSGYDMNNLYRSTNGRDGFRLLEEVDNNEFFDRFELPLGRELPPFGNPPDDIPVGEFNEGSIIHPAQFGVAFSGKILYFSARNKYHVWPEEYQIELNNTILAIALIGNSVIAFTTEEVLSFSGSNPEFMTEYFVTNNAPMLNKASLCRIHAGVFYVSREGMFMVTQGSVTNVTKSHYTHCEWLALMPETMSAKVSDDSIFLESEAEWPNNEEANPLFLGEGVFKKINLRIDMDEQIKQITTYSQTSDAGAFQWKSRKYHFDQRETFDYVKVDADEAVTVKVYADGVEVGSFIANDYNPVIFNKIPHAYDWEFQIESEGEVRSVEIFERVVVPMGDSINLAPENNLAWRLAWLKFPDMGSFAGGMITVEDESKPVTIEFFHESFSLVHTVAAFSGRVFRLPSTLPAGTLWRVSVPSKDHTVKSLVLFSRRTQPIRNRVSETRTDPSVQPWVLKNYEAARPINLAAAQVRATNYPVKVSFFINDKKAYELEFINDKPRRLPHFRNERRFSFEIDESNGMVTEFHAATSMGALRK